jgi:hexosaminidase
VRQPILAAAVFGGGVWPQPRSGFLKTVDYKPGILRGLKRHETKIIRLIAALVLIAPLISSQQTQLEIRGLPLMPWPASVTLRPGAVPIDTNFSVSLSGSGASDSRVKDAVQRLYPRLSRQVGALILPHIVPHGSAATLAIVVEQKDHKAPQRLGDNERYSLQAANGQIRLSADAPLGVLRGMETLLQLVQQNTAAAGGAPAAPGFSVPDVAIFDNPRFGWRGLSLDVSRHFISVNGVKRTLDGMSAVKLDVLHWHLSDDQGFRVESKRYPRLQKYGSDGLYYTQAEVRDVIAYARDRGIRIVPEFDMPGHATSWLVGYPNLGTSKGSYQIVRQGGILNALMDPTKESTYRFLDRFVGEMASLFPDEYFHIGGDEVNPKDWNESPHVQAFMRKHHLADAKALQTYFNQRLLKIVAKHHKHMEGWDEVLAPGLPKTTVIQSWRGQQSLWQAARQGYQGILSAGYYLDLMYPAGYHYSVDPLKVPPPAPNARRRNQTAQGPPPGTPADLTPEQQKLILGGEAAMWEELASPENLDAKLWPRLAAIAERFWSSEEITDIPSMYRRLAVTNRWLEWLDLKQRSNLERMRQRLAGPMPYQPLDAFSAILEPVKGYSRHAERYSMFTPLNRLVDSIPPESNSAREFRDTVDAYLAAPAAQRNPEALHNDLAKWSRQATAVRPILEHQSLLNEDIPIADAIVTLCRVGDEALSAIPSTNTSAPAAGTDLGATKQRDAAAVEDASKPQADMLIQIAPAIQKLVEAIPTTP